MIAAHVPESVVADAGADGAPIGCAVGATAGGALVGTVGGVAVGGALVGDGAGVAVAAAVGAACGKSLDFNTNTTVVRGGAVKTPVVLLNLACASSGSLEAA